MSYMRWEVKDLFEEPVVGFEEYDYVEYRNPRKGELCFDRYGVHQLEADIGSPRLVLVKSTATVEIHHRPADMGDIGHIVQVRNKGGGWVFAYLMEVNKTDIDEEEYRYFVCMSNDDYKLNKMTEWEECRIPDLNAMCTPTS